MTFQTTIIAFSILSIIFLTPPLIWHCKNKNISAISLLTWLMIMNIETCINAFIWGGDDFYTKWDGKGYCDVMTKFEVGSGVGIICAIASLSFNLYLILDGTSTIFLNSTKKLIIELSICFISPVVLMALNYIDQGRRFALLKYRGCSFAAGENWTVIVIYDMWPLLWSLIAFIFALLTLLNFLKKKKDIDDILLCTNSGLTVRKFARLLLFCFMIIICMIPLSLYNFITDFKIILKYRASYSWSSVHPKMLWGIIPYEDLGKSVIYDKWCMIALSFVAFIIFGLGSEAIEMYKQLLFKVGFEPIFNKISGFYNSKFNKRADDLTNKSFYNYTSEYYHNSRMNSNNSDNSHIKSRTLTSTFNKFDSNIPSSTSTKVNSDLNFDIEKLQYHNKDTDYNYYINEEYNMDGKVDSPSIDNIDNLSTDEIDNGFNFKLQIRQLNNED